MKSDPARVCFSNHNRLHIACGPLFLLGFILLSGNGCSFVGSDSEGESLQSLVNSNKSGSQQDPPRSGGKKVRWDGGGVVLGQADNAAFTPSSFRKTISTLVAESKQGSAKSLVQQYPDVALAVLQQMDPATQELEALKFVAIEFDQSFVDDGSKVWTEYFSQVSSNSRSISRTNELRQRFWDLIKRHETEQALQLGLSNSLDRKAGPMLRAECHRLEAIGYMMNGQPKEAARSLNLSLDLTDSNCPFLGSTLRLLLGEFFRHNQQFNKWKSTWHQAVIQHSQWLAKDGIHDPHFWNRAAYLRPADTEWPKQAIKNHLAFLMQFSVQPADAESAVWCSTGYQHLLRSEGQVAVLAFKKAEALASGDSVKTHLQLQQARAMIIAGQPGPASAILIRLISKHENAEDLTHISDRCKAILGTLKLQNGGVMQGMNLIQSAAQSVESWPRDEKLRAQADYGLALLMRGRQQEGVSLLDDLHQQFVRIRRWQQAHQCLWNVAKFYEETDQKKEHRDALKKLQTFEQG